MSLTAELAKHPAQLDHISFKRFDPDILDACPAVEIKG
jgi:hypothetical protein